MWIERIKIEGGVLDGFDQKLSSKLNVLIGGRGTGKSSVIELIRFCLGATSYTPAGQKEAVEHALGVLGDGRVTITVIDGEVGYEISRTAQDTEPDISGLLTAPFVFSQSEIETIGLQSESRLRLIDGFLTSEERTADNTESIVARIRSTTAEIRALLSEIDDIWERAEGLPALQLELAALKEQRDGQSIVHQEIEHFRVGLEEVTPQIAAAHVRFELFTRTFDRFTKWVTHLDSHLEHRPSIESWPSQAIGADELSELRHRETFAIEQLMIGLEGFRSIWNDLEKKKLAASGQRIGLENRAREIRQKMEEKQKGASALDKRISDLNQQISVLMSLIDLKRERETRVVELQRNRNKLLDIQERTRQNRTAMREKVASRLNKDLGPGIRVAIRPFAQRRDYVSALAGALRGSGLRYAELSEHISEIYSPQEIALLVERRDIEALTSSLDITLERALRLCDGLRGSAGSVLFSTIVEDDVHIELMDGSDYKGIDFLSMGQRCTAILPIILRHMERIIILDQPEDHLDNAFVVGTLVKSISARSNSAQTLVATHNPNIPVIGNADRVIHLDSDGNRCFVRSHGRLDSRPIVDAITTIMEGGLAAFEQRAQFYGAKSTNVFD